MKKEIRGTRSKFAPTSRRWSKLAAASGMALALAAGPVAFGQEDVEEATDENRRETVAVAGYRVCHRLS